MATTASTVFQNLDRAIAAYAQEAYTGKMRIIGTELVTGDAEITGSMEDYTGWLRHMDYVTPTVNVADQSVTDGDTTNTVTTKERYIKTVRTFGEDEYVVQRVISQQMGIDVTGNRVADFMAHTRDESLRAILNAVAQTEAGVGIGQTVAGAPQDTSTGFYVDMGDAAVQAFYKGSAGELIDDAQTTISGKLSPLLAAITLGWKDKMPEMMYLFTTPTQFLKLQNANLIDFESVEDGNVMFKTILSGAIRVIVSGTAGKDLSGLTNVAAASDNTSFLCMPGAVSLVDFPVPNPIAFDNDESKGKGSGTMEMWARTGYIIHPRGYSWSADTNTAFVSDEAAGATGYYHTTANSTNWGVTAHDRHKRILPIFHAA